MSVNRILVWSIITASLSLAAISASAQAPPTVISFTATTVNMTVGNAEPIRINVLAWTPPAERAKFVAAFKEKGEAQLLEAFKGAPAAGYVWTSETLGYTVRYAHSIALPDGGERIILVTERPLGSWSRTPWKAAGAAGDATPAVTAIELRLNRSGRGEGKMTFAAPIGVDEAAQTLALASYEKAPVLLKQVTRVKDARSQ
jgi:hypothetical protein